MRSLLETYVLVKYEPLQTMHLDSFKIHGTVLHTYTEIQENT